LLLKKLYGLLSMLKTGFFDEYKVTIDQFNASWLTNQSKYVSLSV